MPKSASTPSNVITAPAGKPLPPPFLLSLQQGEAARTLLSYVVSLGLPGPDAQLVAVVVAIRAARGGVGNLTGTDLSALRLGDARGAVSALRSLGWQWDDAVFDGDPTTPVPVTVPDLSRETGHPLPFGKGMRSRVSGWTTRGLSAKPVRKLPPAARLAGLFLAAHSTSTLLGQIPPDLPEACRAALPDLLGKGFLAELSEDRCRLDPAVRHLSGMRPPTPEEQETEPVQAEVRTVPAPMPEFIFDAAVWAEWRQSATPALRRHVEAVENCTLCALRPERVAAAFMGRVGPQASSTDLKASHGDWEDAHPDRGPLAAEFTVAFRAEHGHGPSYTQLCTGLRWKGNRSLRTFIVMRLLADGWLTDTSPVPWTLRPGKAAQARGIELPRARGSAAAAPAGA